MRRELAVGGAVVVALLSGYLYAANFKTIDLSNVAKWEYKCLRIEKAEVPTETQIQNLLNENATSGWELAQVVPQSEPSNMLVVMRRSKAEATTLRK